MRAGAAWTQVVFWYSSDVEGGNMIYVPTAVMTSLGLVIIVSTSRNYDDPCEYTPRSGFMQSITGVAGNWCQGTGSEK